MLCATCERVRKGVLLVAKCTAATSTAANDTQIMKIFTKLDRVSFIIHNNKQQQTTTNHNNFFFRISAPNFSKTPNYQLYSVLRWQEDVGGSSSSSSPSSFFLLLLPTSPYSY